MTTISSSYVPFGDLTRYQNGVAITGKSESFIDFSKPAEIPADVKAEQARVHAELDKALAASAKQQQEIEKYKTGENNGIYTQNVSTLSLENAKKNLGFAQLMIERRDDVGSVFHGQYGDKELKNLSEWEAALKDYIGKQESGAAMYSKVQDMS